MFTPIIVKATNAQLCESLCKLHVLHIVPQVGAYAAAQGDLSGTVEVSINRALAPPHPCLPAPQTVPLSSLDPPDKLPPCLKVGHYHPPTSSPRGSRWALIAISRVAAPVDSTEGQKVGGEFRAADSRARLLSCLINAFYTSATPLVTT